MKKLSNARHWASLRIDRLRRGRQLRQQTRRIAEIEAAVRSIEPGRSTGSAGSVLHFHPTSHMMELTVNAAAGILTAWSLRLAGTRVRHLVCHAGMSKCVLGTNRADPLEPPPCDGCIAHSAQIYPGVTHQSFPAPALRGPISDFARMSADKLMQYRHRNVPVGELCATSARWVLGRQNLDSSFDVQPVLARFMESAVAVADSLEAEIVAERPRCIVLFNGGFFPEGTARAVALEHGIPVVTYESGFRPLSVFWSHGLATEYAIDIPESFQMGPVENAELDAYLGQRFQGNFTMAGVRFWPEMKTLPPDLQDAVRAHRDVITVFTNVAFDTSQTYANTLFSSMFEWLDTVLGIASRSPRTLFVVRVHPEEARPYKESREPAADWMMARGYDLLPNVKVVGPQQYVSSYELIRQSKACLVYNSTIALESTMLGTPVVMGGRARFSREPLAHAPGDRESFTALVARLVDGEAAVAPAEWRERARRYMYYSFYRTSLSLEEFIQPMEGYDHAVRSFDVAKLHPNHSREMRIICNGIIDGAPFHY